MRFTAKQYAEGLYEATKGKESGEVKVAIGRLVKLLVGNNDFGKVKAIINEYAKAYDKGEGLLEAEVISAHELNDDVVKLLNEYILKVSGAEKVIVNQKVDKDILGGVIIKYEDKVVDGSLRKKLFLLGSQISK